MHSVPVPEAGRAMGFYNGVSRAGSVAGLFGGALIVDGVGYHTAMLILAGISLLGVPLALKAFATPLPGAAPQSSAVARWPLLLVGAVVCAVTIAVVFTDRAYRAGTSLNDRIESSERTTNREDR